MLLHPRGNFDSFFYYVSQIFDSLVHPLKLVKIKNPFRILLTDSQLPQNWVVFLFWTKYVLLGYPSVCIRGKTAQIGPNGTKQARFCVLYAKEDTGLRKVNLHWWWRWWLIWTRGGDLEEWRQRTFSDFGDLSLVNTFPHAVKFQLPNSPLVNWKRG